MDSINQPNYERPLNQLCRLGADRNYLLFLGASFANVENKYREASESKRKKKVFKRPQALAVDDLDHLRPLFKAFAFHLFIGTIRAIPSREIADAVLKGSFNCATKHSQG